ncbi:hypothetical protein Pyn_32026 [Prunus yedoensis var. nudiflora]|uniref:Uncharacterized protein n=1 Tax=Prunus yedoensis var. nudiflora TaxID=2094558 RepID=A0A314XJ85_PRUYE|nr:hypothetical protein Pyn_32026 [Prunus yedoensis var. nudiflora]
MRLSEKDGWKAIQSPLTHGEKKTLQWLKSTDSNYPSWPSTTCPRQLDDTVDCRVIVMYLMWTISKGQNMGP